MVARGAPEAGVPLGRTRATLRNRLSGIKAGAAIHSISRRSTSHRVFHRDGLVTRSQRIA
jgi:hypothetical protein